MDASKTCDRSPNKGKSMTPEEYRMRESTFDSPYPLENHWMFGLESVGYKLIGEYQIDETSVFYRWELDENCRNLAGDKAPHIENVIVHSNSKEPKLGECYEVKKCPTCGKPI